MTQIGARIYGCKRLAWIYLFERILNLGTPALDKTRGVGTASSDFMSKIVSFMERLGNEVLFDV